MRRESVETILVKAGEFEKGARPRIRSMKHDFALQTAWARHSFGESRVKHQLVGEARAEGLLMKDMKTNAGKSHLEHFLV